MGSEQFTVFGHSAAGSYRTVLYGTMRCVLVKVKCWGSGIKLLDDVWEMAVKVSVHTIYRYIYMYVCVCVCVMVTAVYVMG